MRQTLSKWIAVLGAIAAAAFVVSVFPACDQQSNDTPNDSSFGDDDDDFLEEL